jgi:hypothetical protein
MPSSQASDALAADPSSMMLAQPDRPALNALAGQDPNILDTVPNYKSALEKLKLNEQEQFLYQLHAQNLAAGGVANPKGGTSTLFAATFEIGGKTYVIPTVWNGQILQPDQALAQAKAIGLDKFPSYGSEDEAEARYDAMHGYMEKDLPAGD